MSQALRITFLAVILALAAGVFALRQQNATLAAAAAGGDR